MKNIVVDNVIIVASPMDILEKLRKTITNGKLFYVEDKGDNIKVTCPYHADGKERNPSCYLNVTKDSTPYLWAHCFTCGLSCPFEKFVALCLDSSESYAIKWLKTNFISKELQSSFELEPLCFKKPEVIKHDYDLSEFASYHPYMTKRHMTQQVIEDFELKYDQKTDSIVFPVRDRYNNIAFLTRRSVEGKKFIIDKNANKEVLYGINKVYNNNYGSVYIVESQFNCLTLWSWGYPALCMFGCGCPDDQIDVLNSLNVRKYILALDNDEAGWKGTLKLCKKISNSKFVEVVRFKDSRDVNDLTKQEFDSLDREDRFVYTSHRTLKSM